MPLGLDATVPQFVLQFRVATPRVSAAAESWCGVHKPAASAPLRDDVRALTLAVKLSRPTLASTPDSG